MKKYLTIIAGLSFGISLFAKSGGGGAAAGGAGTGTGAGTGGTATSGASAISGNATPSPGTPGATETQVSPAPAQTGAGAQVGSTSQSLSTSSDGRIVNPTTGATTGNGINRESGVNQGNFSGSSSNSTMQAGTNGFRGNGIQGGSFEVNQRPLSQTPGVITIQGVVPSAMDKLEIERQVRKIKGVLTVNNLLEVSETTPVKNSRDERGAALIIHEPSGSLSQ